MKRFEYVSTALKYYHTIKYLKPIQIYGQLIYRFKRTRINKSPPPELRKSKGWKEPIIKSSSKMLSSQRCILLNNEKDISAKNIWFDTKIDKLWLYNLHYFDILHQNTSSSNTQYNEFIQRWINENPPAHGYGWDPYTLSLRIVNWIKWTLAGNQADQAMLHSLAIQIRYLYQRLEIHLLGNHLFANAKALIFSGLFFKGNEAKTWFEKGFKLLKQEIANQILADGGHCELSPMYHCIILEDILDIINLFKNYSISIPFEWMMICDRMFYWLNTMSHRDGEISFFNDAALDIAPTLYELNEYRRRLLLNEKKYTPKSVVYLPASGYCRVQKNETVLITDIAKVGPSYQPGHAHADTLTFELAIGQTRLIVNSGTSCYSVCEERLRQRGSNAHNTLVIDDYNSSEVWKSFRVARRAQVQHISIQEVDDKVVIQASHDGYHRLDKIIHTRSWIINQNELIIQDHVSGFGYHKIELFFHIHPDIRIKQDVKHAVIFYHPSGKILGSLETSHHLKLVDTTYHPQFNSSIPNKKIVVSLYQQLPLNLHTNIKWNPL